MKKVVFITLVVAAMIGVSSGVGYARQIGNSGSVTKVPITYQVNVYPSADFLTIQAKFWVIVIDGTRKMVVPPQLYTPRKTTYDFHEMGPVIGYRAAYLIPDDRLKTPTYFLNPDYRFDTFTGGNTYMFNLYPSLRQPD